VDRRWVALVALQSLTFEGTLRTTKLAEAIKRYGIDPEKPQPVAV